VDDVEAPQTREHALGRRAVLGVFLVTLVVYALTNPGRFDSIDTQWRYEVSSNLLSHGSLAVRDPALLNIPHVRAPDGTPHAIYGLMGSVLPMPLMLLGRALAGAGSELERFLFALTSAVFGALTASALARFYLDLGLSRRRAVGWSLVAAFASMLWPLACSTLDNVLHAFFALTGLRLAWRAGVTRSWRLSLAAGVTAGALFTFRETFGVLMPGLALATLGAAPFDRRSFQRYAAFGAGSALGLAAFFAHNFARFGAVWPNLADSPAAVLNPTVFGHPLVGLLSLLVSPGRSVFLFSPPLLLGAAGMAALWRRERSLALAVVVTSACHLALISSISMFAGEWCWGPRYLGVLLPLWALGAPFLPEAPWRRPLVLAAVALGLCVQVLAVSVEHTTFYVRHRLPTSFWADDRWFYFRESALLDRPRELVDMLRAERPRQAQWFAPTLHRGQMTAAPVRVAEPAEWPALMPMFLVYYVPRPWPFWVRRVARAKRFVPVNASVLGLLALGALGASMLRRATKDGDDSAPEGPRLLDPPDHPA
jgi:hypothetical protein